MSIYCQWADHQVILGALSHSSQDKRFITRLAVDLSARGIPVWFDSWELETGDSLYDRIFTGIDDSTFLVLALSPNSVGSRWVGKELNAALAKEDRLRRKVILPIKLAACDIPLAIADRLYADFTGGYLHALENLEQLLRKYGADWAKVPLERQILPLVLTNGLYLERVALQSQYERLVPALREGTTIVSMQIVVAPDDRFDEMRSVLLETIDAMDKHPRYFPDMELHFRTLYDQVRKLEAALPAGVADIANGLATMGDWAFFAEASHWYARILRSELVYRLKQSWAFSKKSEPPLGTDAIGDVIGSNVSAAKFFGVDSVMSCDLFKKETGEYFKVWVDRGSEVGRWFDENPQFPDSLRSFWSPTLLYQFVVPQMVARHRFYSPRSTNLAWDLPAWLIGAA